MLKNYNLTLQTNNSSLEEIITQLNKMPNAGGDVELQDKTITPTTSQQTVTADEGYDGLNIVTVDAMPTADQATPTISVDTTSGLITAVVNQAAGYVSGGIKTGTSQLAFQTATTITPGTTNQIAVSAGTYVGGAITVQGDANLVADNIVSGASIFGVVGTASAGGSGGDTSIEDGLITRTFTTYTNNRVTTIGDCAFRGYASLTSVNFPACTSIGSGAFEGCSNLTSASFPLCTTIGSSAFNGANKLTSANFPVCTTIDRSAFAGASKLTSVSFPVCTSIGSKAFGYCNSLISVNFPACITLRMEAFYDCANLTSVDFPVCTGTGDYTFYNCSSLTTANFPKCTNAGLCAFSGCTSLTSISLPACNKIYMSAFLRCSSLTSVSLPVCSSIGSDAFKRCTSLNTIYLMNSSVCYIAGSNAFSSTGITSTTGSIFVPASLVDAYKSSTNWTYFSNQIFGV